jgi:tellurite resistance protein TerC
MRYYRSVEATFEAWVALVAGLAALLLFDLLVLNRGAHAVSIRKATLTTAGFVAVSVAFGLGLTVTEGHHIGAQFFAGYLLEWSLSLDNVFVWALIIGAFSVPAAYQNRVLFYGIVISLVLRGAFVAAGAGLLRRFEWIVYVFGVLLLWSGLRLLRGGRELDPGNARVLRLLRRHMPTTNGLVGTHLVVREREVPEDRRPDRAPLRGGWYATPLLAVVAVIAFTDVIFAVDSIPAIFGVTREPFLVFSATALALVGLRSMYFVLAGARDRFVYLDVGLAVILIFIGAKFLLTEILPISVGVSLAVIVVVMGVAVFASMYSEGRSASHG